MSVKIVHAADFHLDSAFGALSGEQARQRRRESRELLTRLANYVNQNGVDVVLLAGDLFDSDTTYRETLEALSDALGAMRARVFIAPGNHDPYSAKSPYATSCCRSFRAPCAAQHSPQARRRKAYLQISMRRRTDWCI